MTATCMKPNCRKPPAWRQLCVKHYRYSLHTGEYGYRNSAPVREHFTKLRESGWTWAAITEAAGMDMSGVLKIAQGRYRRVLPETYRAVLAIPVRPMPTPRGGVDPTGTRRRVQALMWMGWTGLEISRRVGLRGNSLQCLISGDRRPSHAVAKRVAAVYEELGHIPGPSRMTAGRARANGYAPPLAWDDIDNPLERPKGVRRRRATAEQREVA